MSAIAGWLRDLAVPARWSVIGATSLGLVGAIAGLVIGFRVYVPTAPFAVIELGLPSAIVGGIVGLVAGSIRALSARRRVT